MNPIVRKFGNCAYTDGGGFVMVYTIELREAFTLSEEDILKIRSDWYSMVKNLPANSFIHRFGAYINGKINQNFFKKDTELQTSIYDHFKDREQTYHYEYLTIGIKNLKTFHTKLKNPFSSNLMNVAIEESRFIHEEFVDCVKQQIDCINQSKYFSVRPLTEEELDILNFKYFNLFKTEYTTTCDFDTEDKKVVVEIGNNKVEGFTIFNELQLPNELDGILPDPIINENSLKLDCSLGDTLGLYIRKNHYYSVFIHKEDENDFIRDIESKRDNCNRFNFVPRNKNSAKKLDSILEELDSDYNDKIIVKSNVSIFYWADSDKELEKIRSEISGVLQKRSIIPSYPIKKHLKHLFICSNPFYTSCHSELSLYPSFLNEQLFFLSNVTNYRQDGDGVVLCDRFNLPVVRDLYDEDKVHIASRSFGFFAPTTGGKSVALNYILAQFVENNVKVVICEIGNSAGNIIEFFGDKGTQIKFQTGKPLGVNPFNRPIEELLSADKLTNLTRFVFAHFGKDEDMKTEEQVFIRNVLRFYIDQTKTNLSFKGFIRFFYSREKEIKTKFSDEVKNIEYSLYKVFLKDFDEGGVYAYLYENAEEDNVISESLQNKMVIGFELDEARNDARLLGVLIQTIQDVVYTNVWKDRHQKGIVVFDEFAEFINYPNILSIVAFYFQAIRKQNGGVGIVLQSIEQLPKNELANSIIENMKIMYFLQNDKGYNFIKDRLKLDENRSAKHLIELLNSLKNKFLGDAPKYSEICIWTGNYANVFRIELSRLYFLLLGTDGEEYRKIDKMKKNGKTIQEAIKNLL